jgi:anionic cell wall polymer biosynthesis LytR-Cps2A-Psr (LCP) family protein
VVVDFTVLVKLVDALGGISMDITEAEMQHINKNVLLSKKVFKPLGYTATELKTYGENVRLNGLRALAYARIRKLDSDFKRTSRQRAVIEAMLGKLKSRLWNPVTVTEFVATGLSGIETNLSTVEMLSLGAKALLGGEISQLRLPLDGTFSDDGSSLSVTNRTKNIEVLREFLYGEEGTV